MISVVRGKESSLELPMVNSAPQARKFWASLSILENFSLENHRLKALGTAIAIGVYKLMHIFSTLASE